MSNWIQLNIKYSGIRADEALKIARQNKISKPSVPMLENEALKKFGFNNKTLFKEYKSYGCFNEYYYNNYYYNAFFKVCLDFLKKINTKKDLLEYFQKNKKGIYNYNLHSIYGNRDGYIDISGAHFNYDQIIRMSENIISIIKLLENKFAYEDFIKNHPKTIKYNERIKEFESQIEKIKKDNCFTLSKYNKPGYLVNIETPDGNLSQFLIGHGSHLNIPNDSKVIRVKKVVDDDEIFGNLLFT